MQSTVFQMYDGGAACAQNMSRQAAVVYTCDPGLSTDTIMEVTEHSTCNYTLRVHTPRICTCTAPWAGGRLCGQPIRKKPLLEGIYGRAPLLVCGDCAVVWVNSAPM